MRRPIHMIAVTFAVGLVVDCNVAAAQSVAPGYELRRPSAPYRGYRDRYPTHLAMPVPVPVPYVYGWVAYPPAGGGYAAGAPVYAGRRERAHNGYSQPYYGRPDYGRGATRARRTEPPGYYYGRWVGGSEPDRRDAE